MNHDHQTTALPVTHPTLRDYVPLMVVMATIIAGTVALCWQDTSIEAALGYSMGLFFLVFGMFKLIDLPNFAMGYREYDLLAQRVPAWGYMYPFIELCLGAFYLARIELPLLHIVTLALSLLVVIGVSLKLAKHEQIHCVCLGNVLKVPLTYVSLVEYAAMGAMALGMLFL